MLCRRHGAGGLDQAPSLAYIAEIAPDGRLYTLNVNFYRYIALDPLKAAAISDPTSEANKSGSNGGASASATGSGWCITAGGVGGSVGRRRRR